MKVMGVSCFSRRSIPFLIASLREPEKAVNTKSPSIRMAIMHGHAGASFIDFANMVEVFEIQIWMQALGVHI